MTGMVPASVFTLYYIAQSQNDGGELCYYEHEQTIYTTLWGAPLWGWDMPMIDSKGAPLLLDYAAPDGGLAQELCKQRGYTLYDYALYRLTKHKDEEVTIECVTEFMFGDLVANGVMH
jgi:hypothetical protein